MATLKKRANGAANRAVIALARDDRRFACTGCGRCCYGGPYHIVEVTREEQRAIRQALAISPAWFRRRYVRRVDEDLESLRFEEDGRCPFLGADNRCSIYAIRPKQCRLYPFWPELVGSAKTWRTEGRRCEGLGRGPVIPLREIEEKLKEQERD